MCGIVGYVGGSEAAPIVLDGLARLEYRGYDSAGIAVLDDAGRISIAKEAGKLAALQAQLAGALPPGRTGIGHTRWATHGKATQLNAHPHTDASGDVVVIHNGIVENYRELREELIAAGCRFRSETDTEVIPHLIAAESAKGMDLEAATRAALSRIEGAAAVLVMRRQEPGVVVAARIANAGGVVVGYGEGEMFVASDLPAIVGHTQRAVFLEDGDVVRVTPAGASYTRLTGERLTKEPQTLRLDAAAVGKGVYEHFMAKEIAEQPEAVLDTLRGAAVFDPPPALPAEADNASEYRYRQPILDDSTLVVAVAQSGETVDTLAAMQEAKRRGDDEGR